MYKAAVIGVGNIGFKFSLDSKRKGTWSHVDAYMKCEKTHLSAVVEPDESNRKLFMEHHPVIPVYATVDEMMSRHQIDIISIAVPTKFHYDIISDVTKYPLKAIFCEKPLSYSINESKFIVETAEEKNIVLAVNYTRRWQNSYKAVKRIIEEGRIGKVTTVTGYYPENIFNVGSHLIDTINMLVPVEPKSVTAYRLNDSEDPAYSGCILSDNGICISFLATGKREDLIFEIEVTGTEGRIKIYENGEKVDYFRFRDSQNYSGYRELSPEHFDEDKIEENDRFLDAIYDITDVIEGKSVKPLCSGKDAFKTDIIISKIIDSNDK